MSSAATLHLSSPSKSTHLSSSSKATLSTTTSSKTSRTNASSYTRTDASSTTTGSSPHHRKKKPRGRKDLYYPDIFADHWLVESPRKIQFERTTLGMSTPLSDTLDDFYDEIVRIPQKRLHSAISKAQSAVEYIQPRVSKLGNSLGLRVTGAYYAGGVFTDQHVILPYEMEVLFVMHVDKKTKIDALDPGYAYIPLKRYRDRQGEPPDAYRYGRSDDGTYLSSLKVARAVHDLTERAIKLHPHITLEPFKIHDGCAQITTIVSKKYTLNIIPAIYVESEDMHLVTRPYTFDENPHSDIFWRVSYVKKEKEILDKMDHADRGVRRKAYRILKALIKVEHTLAGITSYHVKTVLLYTFDGTVDNTPRWQKNTTESCFLNLLSELCHYLSIRELPHFFNRSCNLFSNVPSRLLNAWRNRVAYLCTNQGELMRILQKQIKN